ncbi:uncharacterized protein GGS22DRAFT_188687 [Annulohypoxylon maeteangense]|uniref:uncharacterized protein n=1 Tax=Annulohypoxylon maeteangense TaxID=1927788 RepID=UPI002008CABF|nr:uncharacterized protein GGS22DRAFT_188687 [Annulohypoxylon maeteangense]KAI0885398.1 hypothetical protein GGS22DRAFT_188687 [Annulohypoxylon maeteangense]
MSTICDYDLPKEKRPEGSRNFPLVFPSYADMHSDVSSPGGSSTLETWGRVSVALDHRMPVTRGFPAYGKAIPWLDAAYPFDKTTIPIQCPEPESDGQESTTSNTPKVVLPPQFQDQHDSGIRTPIRGHYRETSLLPFVSGDPFQHQPQARAMRAPPGFSQQPQGRSVPGPPSFHVSTQNSGNNDTYEPDFKPSRRQIITDPRQVIVSSPTFNAQYAPLQSRREQNQEDFWLAESHQLQMAGSPMGTSMDPDTPLSQPSRRSHRTRRLNRRRQTLADRMAREEAARGFDSEDDNEFYPHADN